MNDRIAILRQAITAVTQSLSNTDVKVTQAGLEAYVRTDETGKPVQVNLPYVPDNADESLIDAIQGFLDHEVAHILFSDFTATSKIRDKHLHTIVNVLEDARIEKEMANKYRGCGINLRNTGEFFLENLIQPDYEKLVEKGASQEEFIGQLISPLLRGMSGQEQHKEYMKDKLVHVQDFYDKIADLEPKMEALSSTADVINMAKTIIERIKDETPPEPENNDDSDNQDESKSDSGKDESSSPTGGESGLGEDEGEAEGGGSGSSDGDDDGDGNGSSEGKSEGEESKDKGKEGKSSMPDLESKVSNIDPVSALDEIDKNKANSFDSALSRKMGEQAALAAKGARYLVYSQDYDKIETLPVGSDFRAEMVKRMTDKVDSMVGPMAKDLERAMIARSKAVWESGLRKGKLNASALSRLRTGDDRVFRQRHESTTNDVAVSLVVDASGSMYGSKIHTAAMSAYALSSVLDRLKIAHEVICFTTGSSPNYDKIREQEKKYGVEYSRYESLYMPIVKGFKERIMTETKKRFAWLPNASFLANNVDGECIDIAYNRLRQRKEKGKIMIVLSDGCPCAQGNSSVQSRHLKDTVQKIEKSGTKIIGIGIQSTAVRTYYTKNIVVNEVEELPKGVIRELRAMLLANN
ncbi:cobalamin biosynthesis protein CobT [Acinetobacter baumannii]